MEGKVQASDGNSVECSKATKTILEDVCLDFESMDVINPKSNKMLDVPKSRPYSSRKPVSVQNKSSSTGAVSTVVQSNNMLEVQNKSSPLPPVDNIFLNAVIQNETGSSDIALEQSENDLLQQSYCAAVGHTTSTIEVNSETGLIEDNRSISFVSGDFSNNENIPSMAQLADAEIIQTDENSVSIIITNPRLIKLMTNADNSLSSAMASASMIDSSTSFLESTVGASEQIGVVDSTGVVDSSGISTFKIEDIGLSDNTSVLNNIFVETEAEISNSEISNIEVSNSEVTEKQSKRGRTSKKKVQPSVPVKEVGRGKSPKFILPKALQQPRLPPTTGTTTKARRITAKMKDAWSKQLQKTGCLVCHVPGCSQTYVTVANFATHYKYCTGKKNLQHCLYCDSLIFSSNKAVLQHMEVEHSDKVEEYKAKYPEACAVYDEQSLPSHLIVAEDENVAMNVEEVTQPQRKKRKLSSKENVLSPPKAILKHKMKCINESVNENIKEFKKCVRFDNIVDKINSVDEFSKVIKHATEMKPQKKQKKKRVYVTGKIVAEKEYFEDDDDAISMSQEEEEEAKNREMMHTKARMVLNLERYKRYKEYLKLTRDWSSERKTYSRSRGSDTSLDTSYLLALQNEYLQDAHQLHATVEPSTNISLDISQNNDSQLDLETTPIDLNSIQTFEVIQTEQFVSVQPIQSSVRQNVTSTPIPQVTNVTSTPISEVRDEYSNNLSLNLNEISSVAIDLPTSSHETTRPPSFVLNRERVPCYNRPSLLSNVVSKSETPRSKRFGSAITFGVTVPTPPTSKPPEPTITFDTLINLSQKQVKKNSQVSSDKIVSVTHENASNHIREDGIKHPANLVDGKRKKGQPKISRSKMVMSKTKNANSKKCGAAVLKSIKNNVRNRNAKLLKLKNTSKLKCDSKKIIRISQLRTNRLNLKSAQQKFSHQNLSSVNNSLQNLENKASEEESVVQCVENIDNHISLTENISQIECFTADHNYSHPTNICSVDAINNVAEEVEITSSNIEDVEVDKMNIDSNTNIEENAVVQPNTSDLDTHEIEAIGNSSRIDLKTMPAEFLKDSQELECNLDPSMQINIESISADTHIMGKVANVQTARNITDIHVVENVISTQIAEKIITDAQISERTNTDVQNGEKRDCSAQIAEVMDTDTQIIKKTDTINQIDEEINIDIQIAEKVNTDTPVVEKVDADTLIAQNIARDVEKIDTESEILEKLDTEGEIAENIVSDAEKVNIDAQIPENVYTISQIVKKVDINTQSAENADMDTQSAERVATDSQVADSVINNLTENDNALVEGKSVNASMEKTPTVQTMGADILISFPVLGTPDNSRTAPLLSDNHVAFLPGDVKLKKNDSQEKSTEVPKVSAEIEQISTAAQATSAQIQEISANALNGNNTTSEELPLNDKSKQLSSNEVKSDNKKSEVCENSEINLKSDVPEVQIKRGRGRPRKIRREKMTTAPNDAQVEAKVKSKVVDNTKENETEKGDSLMQSSIDENRSSGGWRKSERLKKRKLVEEEPFKEPVEKENEIVQETAPGTLVPVTGKRGRSKKYLLNDSDTNAPVNDSLNTTITETEVVDENLRKFSRKGRPRKCVRYADLNSGIESSESLDGSNTGGSAKDRQDDTAAVKEADNVQDAYEKEKQEEKILPLKKRKQRQSKKEEFIDENAGQKQDSESISPDEKKIKIDDHVENEKQTRGGRVLRTRKSTCKKYANDYELDDPLDKDFEDKAENSESDEIYDPVERNETSSKRWNSKFSRKLAAKIALVRRDHKKESFSHLKDIFSEFKPKKYMWKLLSGTDYYECLPPLKNSVYFKIKKAWNDSETVWSSLRCFDSLPIDKESSHVTFFTGGPVLCSAWCPVPADSIQYIAVAVRSTLNKHQSYLCTDAEKGLIQLWNLGFLTDKLHHPKPVMELSISHNHGFISDMAWCPAGCWENPATESIDDSLPRLGMLAISCSDSFIRIYSIPHPRYLPKGPTSFSIYSSCPSLLLKPLYGGECMATRKSMCVCVAWQKTDNCERIVGGYGNGMICIWLINSSATILATKEKDQTIISPYLIFSAHGTPVTSVSFAPLSGARFLMTSSTDKTLKFWDIFDTSLPFFTVHRGASRYAEWAPNVCGAIASLDYGMCSWKGATFFKECGTENSSSRNCGKPCCSIRRSSFTEWLTAQALGDLSGEVSVSFLNGPLCGDTRGSMFFCRFVYQAKMEVIEGEIENQLVLNESEIHCSNSCLGEMQDVVHVVDTMIEKCNMTLNPKRLRKKRRRSELEAEECLLESTDVFQNCVEAAEVISLVTNMKDVVSTMNSMVEQNFFKTLVAAPQNDNTISKLEKSSVNISEILCNIVEEVGRRAESYSEISNILSNIVSEVTNIAEISDVLYNIIAEVRNSAEISNILNKITAEVTNRVDISNVLNKIIAEVTNTIDISDILNNIVAEVTNRADISDVLNNIVAEVTSRVDISNVLNNIVAEVINRADISNVLSNIVAEVTNRADISDVLHNIVTEVTNRADIFDVLNNIVTEVANGAEICDVLNNIIAEVTNRADIYKVLKNIVAEVTNKAEIYDILKNIIAEVKNRTEISDILNNIVAEITNRADIFDVLSNILAEVRNGAEISDVLNNIIVEVRNKAEIYDILNNIVVEVKNRAEISDVLNNIVAEVTYRADISNILSNILAEVRNGAEISDVLNNIVAEVGNRVENEVEISNVLSNILVEVRNTADSNVEISNILNNIVTKVSIMSSQSENLEHIPEITVENDLTNKIVLEMSSSVRSLESVADTLPDSMEVEISTTEAPEHFVLQNKCFSVDHDKFGHNENMVEETKCDEALTDFQTEYSRNRVLLNEYVTSCNAESSEECSEASALVSQTTDLISLIADMKDLICITSELTSNSTFPPDLLSVLKLDQLQENNYILPSISSCMEKIKSYPNIGSQLFGDCNNVNSASFTISELLRSLVRKVSERIITHPEIRKLSSGMANEIYIKSNSCKEVHESKSLDSSSMKANTVKELEDIKKGSLCKIIEQINDCTDNSRLLDHCLEMRDFVGLVADMKDVVSAMSQLTTDSDKGNENKSSTCDSLLLLYKQNVNDPIEKFNCLLPNNSPQIILDILCKIVKAVGKLANHSDGKLCEDALSENSSVAMKTMNQMETCSIESLQGEERIDANCSEILEIVSLIADVKDVVSASTEISDGPNDSDRSEMSTFSSKLNLGDLSSKTSSLQSEQELMNNTSSAVPKRNCQCDVKSEEIFNVLQNLVETVDTKAKKVSCVGVIDMECDEETSIPLMNEFKVSVPLESDLAPNSLDSSQLLELAVFGDISCSDTFNELTSMDSPSFPPLLTACNNYVPQIVHEESLDNEPPELRNETDDQTMLSIDDNSSSSENEMDTDDEITDFVFERESNFSGDSYLSECSLDSSNSVSFSSGDSVLSESSSSPVLDEQDVEESNLPPVNQNNSEKPHSQIPSSIYSLVAEMSDNLPTTENLSNDISSTVSECTEYPKIVSVPPPVENPNVEEASNDIDKNVPESSVMDSSESCLEPILLSNNETVSEGSVNSFKEISLSPNYPENSELATEQITTDSVCSLPNVNTYGISSQQSGQISQTGHSLCSDNLSDIQHSSNSIETVHVDKCKESCTVNIENNNTDSVFAESMPQVIPESVKRNIFVSEELPNSSCTNIDLVEILNESMEKSADTIPVSENCNKFSNKRLITYESVIAEHGLVFKDMNTADFESIENIPEETSTFPPFDMYHLASVNTVSWNPNYGSHLWLFSAGQSGIARLSYISEITREKHFKRC